MGVTPFPLHSVVFLPSPSGTAIRPGSRKESEPFLHSGAGQCPQTVSAHTHCHPVQLAVLTGDKLPPQPRAQPASQPGPSSHYPTPCLPPLEAGTNSTKRTHFLCVERPSAGSHWAQERSRFGEEEKLCLPSLEWYLAPRGHSR